MIKPYFRLHKTSSGLREAIFRLINDREGLEFPYDEPFDTSIVLYDPAAWHLETLIFNFRCGRWALQLTDRDFSIRDLKPERCRLIYRKPFRRIFDFGRKEA